MRVEALVEGLAVGCVCVNAEIALGETTALIFSGAIVRS